MNNEYYIKYVKQLKQYFQRFLSLITYWFRVPLKMIEENHQEAKRYLSSHQVLENGSKPNLSIFTISFIILFILFFIIWASIAKIEETASTTGQVIPSSAVHTVQHLEGGIVHTVSVKEGQIIKPGQILLSLASEATLAELDQVKARELGLKLQAERLKKFALGEKNIKVEVNLTHPGLLKDQMSILDLQWEAKLTQENVLKTRIDQRTSEKGALLEQKNTLEEQVKFVEEEIEMQERLLKKGLISRVVYLEKQRELSRLKGNLAEVQNNIDKTSAFINEAESSLLELDARLRNEALGEMGKISAELAQVSESLRRLEDKKIRLNVQSPIAGIVKGLAVSTTGTVIAPGETLMEIVPLDDELQVEVKILPNDIGNVHIGQRVDIKVTAYDFIRYGNITGKLIRISASTFSDQEGGFYYKGIVELSKNHVGSNPSKNLILPGMLVQGDIQTGSKTILEYILKPIYRSLDSSFSER